MSSHPPGCGCKEEHELATNSKCIYDNINFPCITAFNELIPNSSKSVFKRYNQRLSAGSVSPEEKDTKLLINIPLLSPTSISHIIVISDALPLKLDIYKSNDELTLEDIEDIEPVQSLTLIPDIHGSILNPLKLTKLTNLSHISLAFGTDLSKDFYISYIGLRGSYQMNTIKAVETVYEVNPNIAEHKELDFLKPNLQM